MSVSRNRKKNYMIVVGEFDPSTIKISDYANRLHSSIVTLRPKAILTRKKSWEKSTQYKLA